MPSELQKMQLIHHIKEVKKVIKKIIQNVTCWRKKHFFKTLKKMKILKEEEKHTVQDFLKILDVIFFISFKMFILVGVFGFLNRRKPNLSALHEQN